MNIVDISEDLTFVKDNIVTLGKKFESNPALFFNESDLQSELFARLLLRYNNEVKIPNPFVWGTNNPKPAKIVYSRRLHSELLLAEGRIDLAVLDLNNVTFAINSKGRFGHIQIESGKHIFIEIKCSRTNRSSITSRQKWFSLITGDIKKLRRYKHPCFMVCFDFNSLLDNSRISKLQKSVAANLELLYFTNSLADYYLADE